MNQEKLIKLVREYTYLYDLTDRKYCNNQRKEEAWKEIADKLHAKVHECKRTWALLRDSYRRTVKKQKLCQNGELNFSGKKWKYEVEMAFLLPYFKESFSKGLTLPNNVDKASDTEENSSDIDIKPEVILPSSPPQNSLNSADGTVSQSTSKRAHSNSGSSLNLEQSRIKIRKKLTPQSTSSDTPTNKHIQYKTKTNDIQQFFNSIITTVQSFPPRDRAIAKAKVFKVISEMEIEILSRDSNTHSDYVDFAALYKSQEKEDEKDYYITLSPHLEDSNEES